MVRILEYAHWNNGEAFYRTAICSTMVDPEFFKKSRYYPTSKTWKSKYQNAGLTRWDSEGNKYQEKYQRINNPINGLSVTHSAHPLTPTYRQSHTPYSRCPPTSSSRGKINSQLSSLFSYRMAHFHIWVNAHTSISTISSTPRLGLEEFRLAGLSPNYLQQASPYRNESDV